MTHKNLEILVHKLFYLQNLGQLEGKFFELAQLKKAKKYNTASIEQAKRIVNFVKGMK